MFATRRWLLVLSAATILTAAPSVRAASPEEGGRGVPAPAGPLTREALDERVYHLLYPVLDEGANLYNTGYPNSCSFLFQGALMSVEPLLDHRPELQKAARKGLAEARQ